MIPRPASRAILFLLLVLLLTACDSPGPVPGPSQVDTAVPPTESVTPPAATPTEESTATLPVQPTAIEPAQSTDTPQPTLTYTPSPLPTAPPTALPTLTPAATTALEYVFPVQPPGVTQFGAYHHDYPAADIFCPIGSTFVAPTSGVVDYVSTKDIWDPKVDDPATRGGLSVAIIGDDGVRYYGSHLNAVLEGITPGVRVKAGQPLGKTGHTGDARYTDPHLHFGISHPTTPGDWKVRRGEISPYKYLVAWKAGKPLQPALK